MGNGYFGGIYFGQYWWPQGDRVISTQDLDGSFFLILELLGEYANTVDENGLYDPVTDIPGEVESGRG